MKTRLTDFGERVAVLRASGGLSQQQLANKTGMRRSYIGGVERGERNITLLNIHRLAAALGVVALFLTDPLPLSTPGTGDGSP